MMKSTSPIYINVKGQLLDLSIPLVMGILNVTPDSFYAGSRMQTEEDIAARARQIIDEGAAIIDIGAYSSRSNAEHISAEEEMNRLRTGLEILNRNHPEAIISVDTFRADVAAQCVNEYGVAIINDIAAGEMDDRMFLTVAVKILNRQLILFTNGFDRIFNFFYSFCPLFHLCASIRLYHRRRDPQYGASAADCFFRNHL